ncbi:trypsin-like peptidase domain-containing protein [Bacteroidia bacterium]|jgi:S1-C subfamily serine protease|nr:trypsin-like peptidase domain-containing protein [Bacteroidia bacterium]
MKKSQSLLLVAVCLMASFLGAFAYKTWFDTDSTILIKQGDETPYRNVNTSEMANLETGFIDASKSSTASVVFIKTEAQQYQSSGFWGFGFDPFGRIGKVASTGSGVIISADGYIVTNNHVIANADKIDVVLSSNKKSYSAELIGADPSSDLALLRVQATDLKPIRFTNSDDVQIGQWVLAVGNPFNLTSTVTAGIVSAKGRNINIVNNQFPIESFIQTDAAINPGNSGGALVNLEGDLVGVNTAIASKTGSYVGYGFAIPSNIVMKTIDDLREYGEVQRGFVGVDVVDIDGDIGEKLGSNGVLIKRITGTNDEAAKKLEVGDVISKINEKIIDSKSTFDERIAYLRPGDIVKFEVFRNENKMELELTLVNKNGTTKITKKESIISETLGGEFEAISKLEAKTFRIENGVKVTNISTGKLRKMNISEGFIFVKVNGEAQNDPAQLIELLEFYKGQVRIEGIASNGSTQFLSFTFR